MLAAPTLVRLDDDPDPLHDRARTFCLSVIKEFYSFDYRPDWHADLDSLLRPAAESQYSAINRGAFWIVTDPETGDIVATAAIKGMGWKPALCEALADRYPQIQQIGSVWRVYVKKDLRGRGLGRGLNAVMESEARALGYDRLYLHATDDATATLRHWRASGYAPFAHFGESVHFDKAI